MGISFRPESVSMARCSVLRSHVAEQSGDCDLIVALREIKSEISRYTELTNEDGLDLLREFFYGRSLKRRVYWPTRLVRLQPSIGSATYLDLAEAVAAESKPGVLLIGDRGAGKKTACLKAFLDCLGASGSEPALGDHLPIWMKRIDPSVESFEKMIALNISDGPTNAEVSTTFIPYSPPLLVFMDLSPLDAHMNDKLIGQVIRFLRTYSRLKHRCMLTIRDSTAERKVIESAQRSGLFGLYRLEGISAAEGRQYIFNLSRFRREAQMNYIEPHMQPQEQEGMDEQEEPDIEPFLVFRSSQSQNVGCSPLVVHEVSKLVTLQQVDSGILDLQGMFRRLVADPLTPQFAQAESARLAPIARVRVALTMVERDQKRLRMEELESILRWPERGRSDSGAAQPWWPEDPFWTADSDYFQLKFDHHSVFAAKNGLREERGEISFQCDELVDFLAAYSLRYYDGPGQPPHGHLPLACWADRAAKRLVRQERLHRQVAWFLSGMLTDEQFAALVMAILNESPAHGLASLLLYLYRGRPAADNADGMVLRLLGARIRRLRSSLCQAQSPNPPDSQAILSPDARSKTRSLACCLRALAEVHTDSAVEADARVRRVTWCRQEEIRLWEELKEDAECQAAQRVLLGLLLVEIEEATQQLVGEMVDVAANWFETPYDEDTWSEECPESLQILEDVKRAATLAQQLCDEVAPRRITHVEARNQALRFLCNAICHVQSAEMEEVMQNFNQARELLDAAGDRDGLAQFSEIFLNALFAKAESMLGEVANLELEEDAIGLHDDAEKVLEVGRICAPVLSSENREKLADMQVRALRSRAGLLVQQGPLHESQEAARMLSEAIRIYRQIKDQANTEFVASTILGHMMDILDPVECRLRETLRIFGARSIANLPDHYVGIVREAQVIIEAADLV